MPYPNEHSARINSPGKYDHIRRKNDEFGSGIDVIFGIKGGKSEVQAIRFDKNKFTPAKAKEWLREHDYKWIEFEAATEGEARVKDELTVKYISLKEAKPDANGTISVKIIEPGWGNSGYYSESVLKAAETRYRTNQHMYWNHQTTEQAQAMPERDLRDLAAVFVEDAYYDQNGKDGPGLYSRFKPFSAYGDLIKELAPYIGVSHVAYGKKKPGEADGRKGLVITEITGVKSVDFVTAPGAGGAILEAFRGAISEEQIEEQTEKQEKESMDEDKLTAELLRKKYPGVVKELEAEFSEKTIHKEAYEKIGIKLDEAKAENAKMKEELDRFKEMQILAEAKAFVEVSIKDAKIPDLTKARIIEALGRVPVVKDGEINKPEYRIKIDEAVKAEAEYLEKINSTGEVKNMGTSGLTAAAGTTGSKNSGLKESFKRMYMQEGKTDKEAGQLAEIAAGGR